MTLSYLLGDLNLSKVVTLTVKTSFYFSHDLPPIHYSYLKQTPDKENTKPGYSGKQQVTIVNRGTITIIPKIIRVLAGV